MGHARSTFVERGVWLVMPGESARCRRVCRPVLRWVSINVRLELLVIPLITY